MNVVIIEDEKMVSDDLSETLRSIDRSICITHTIASVKEAILYFKSGVRPELIFSDIHLGDGYSFEIFNHFRDLLPVIYCTAYDQHALEAFEQNGIAYVLKPYSRESIRQALAKYYALKTNLLAEPPTPDVVSASDHEISSLLVNNRNRITPVPISSIALFYIKKKSTILLTFAGDQYIINRSLDELEDICGPVFFRSSRQSLVNKRSIRDVQHYGFRKLFVSMNITSPVEVIVTKEKITSFLSWLQK